MPFLERDGLKFNFGEFGSGTPLIFSHGLGGNLTHVRDLFGPIQGFRIILYDNRGHGETSGDPDPSRLNFDSMADDMAAVLDRAEVDSAIVGGVSMGAGVSIAFWRRHPERVRALILSRPAWLNSPYPANLRVLGDISKLFDELGAEAALCRVPEIEAFASMRRDFPETARSLMQNLESARDSRVATVYRSILASVPFTDFNELQNINIPALVLANQNDPIHPFDLAERLAEAIPRSVFREFPSKNQGAEEHQQGFRQRVKEFLDNL